MSPGSQTPPTSCPWLMLPKGRCREVSVASGRVCRSCPHARRLFETLPLPADRVARVLGPGEAAVCSQLRAREAREAGLVSQGLSLGCEMGCWGYSPGTPVPRRAQECNEG